MSKKTEKYGDPQDRRRLACMGTVDLITHAIKQSEAVSAQQSRIDALEKALGGLLPFAINEGPGGCDGKTRGCPNCKIIKLARAALNPSDNEAKR